MEDFKNLIVYEDENLVIFNKPIGIPVQSADDSLASIEKIITNYLDSYHIINRIDQVVSGLVLIAKNKSTTSKFSKKTKNKELNKTYIALVEGHLENEFGTVENKLYKKGLKSYVNKTEGKKAVLHYKTLKELENYTFLSINIETGRFHQIRCQLAHMGHPIKGDVKYGSRRSNKERGIYLHCRSIKIMNYPNENKILSLNAEYPVLKLWELIQTI